MNSERSSSRVSSWRWMAASSLGLMTRRSRSPSSASIMPLSMHCGGVDDGGERAVGWDRGEESLERVAVGDVAGGDLDVAAEFVQVGGELVGAGGGGAAAADQQEVASAVALDQRACEQRAQAGRAAGDQHGAGCPASVGGCWSSGVRAAVAAQSGASSDPSRSASSGSPDAQRGGEPRGWRARPCRSRCRRDTTGMLGVGAAQQAGQRRLPQVGPLTVDGRDRAAREQGEPRVGERIGRQPGLHELKRPGGQLVRGLEHPAGRRLDRDQHMLGRLGARGERIAQRAHVRVALDASTRRTPRSPARHPAPPAAFPARSRPAAASTRHGTARRADPRAPANRPASSGRVRTSSINSTAAPSSSTATHAPRALTDAPAGHAATPHPTGAAAPPRTTPEPPADPHQRRPTPRRTGPPPTAPDTHQTHPRPPAARRAPPRHAAPHPRARTRCKPPNAGPSSSPPPPAAHTQAPDRSPPHPTATPPGRSSTIPIGDQTPGRMLNPARPRLITALRTRIDRHPLTPPLISLRKPSPAPPPRPPSSSTNGSANVNSSTTGASVSAATCNANSTNTLAGTTTRPITT